MIDENYAIINNNGDNSFFVRVMSTINKEELKTNSTVGVHRGSYSILELLPNENDSTVINMINQRDTEVTYDKIGGYDQ